MSAADNTAYRVIRHEDERTHDAYTVGTDGVTRICLAEKGGEYAMLLYVQVWKSDQLFMEVMLSKCHGLFWTNPSPDGGDDDIPF